MPTVFLRESSRPICQCCNRHTSFRVTPCTTYIRSGSFPASAPRRGLKKSKDPSRGGDRGLRYASQGTRDALVGYLLPIPWAILRRQYLTLVTFLQPKPSRGVRPWRRKRQAASSSRRLIGLRVLAGDAGDHLVPPTRATCQVAPPGHAAAFSPHATVQKPQWRSGVRQIRNYGARDPHQPRCP
jgi:hypothetical protein